jgi:hypothetical protein
MHRSIDISLINFSKKLNIKNQVSFEGFSISFGFEHIFNKFLKLNIKKHSSFLGWRGIVRIRTAVGACSSLTTSHDAICWMDGKVKKVYFKFCKFLFSALKCVNICGICNRFNSVFSNSTVTLQHHHLGGFNFETANSILETFFNTCNYPLPMFCGEVFHFFHNNCI